MSGFTEWLDAGVDSGYCTRVFCETHDYPTGFTDDEIVEFNDGLDPCMFVVRVFTGTSE